MAQPQCYYHADKRSTAACPTCNQRICDACRLRGNSLRCGTCQSNFQKGGEEPGGKKVRVQCANHVGVPTDSRCVNCRNPYCAACLNSASKCFNCALAAPKPEPSRGGSGRRAAGGGKPGAKGKGKGKSKGKSKQAPPWPLIGGVIAGVLVAGLVTMMMLKPAKAPKPYKVTGPMSVAITAPAAGRALRGPQVIKLKVASPQHIERVELTVDGKYWDKLKQPPFESDWPTSLLSNGKHVIVAKAVYKNKRAVSTKHVVNTQNR